MLRNTNGGNIKTKNNGGNNMNNKRMQRVYADDFATVETARVYLNSLNHALTTKSEEEVDKPNHGRDVKFGPEHRIPFVPKWFGDIKNKTAPFFEGWDDEGQKFRRSPDTGRIYQRALRKERNNGATVKVVVDTKKYGKDKREYVSRSVSLFQDSDSIMSNVNRIVRDEIMGMEIPKESCHDISELLASSELLDMREAERIMSDVFEIESGYRKSMRVLVEAQKQKRIDEDDFSAQYTFIVESCDEALRLISDDRVAIAYCAHEAAKRSVNSAQTFPLKVCLDGFVALLQSTAEIRYEEMGLRIEDIPANATHVIVNKGMFRLTEDIDASKKYIGKIALMNGTYEIYRNKLNGNVSLIVPKPAKKSENMIPIGKDFTFALKVSYKASELAEDHKDGEYVTELMRNNAISFVPTTIGDNTQYCVMVEGTWVGTIFNDDKNKDVLQRDIIRSLVGKTFSFDSVPVIRSSKGKDNNSFAYAEIDKVTKQPTGRMINRPAQVLKFKEIYTPVEYEDVTGLVDEDDMEYMYISGENDYLLSDVDGMSEEELALMDAENQAMIDAMDMDLWN